jgi:hypothetical protein
MHIYVGVARSLEIGNLSSLEKMRHAHNQDEDIVSWFEDFYL